MTPSALTSLLIASLSFHSQFTSIVTAQDADCLALLSPTTEDLAAVDCNNIDPNTRKRKFGINMTDTRPYMYIVEEPDNDPFPCLLSSGELPLCVTSTTGVLGQTIIPHGNYRREMDPPSGFDRLGTIVDEIRIHTPGNTNVERVDFPLWTRWYQEYKNVQIFRINDGEYKVDDDSRGKAAARIEAEMDYSWQANPTMWKRYEGTFTIIKANDATVFQVFTNMGHVWSVILDVDREGILRYVERRGDKTILFNGESILLRPFHVTVCDNGEYAEIFIDGTSVSNGVPYGGPDSGWERPEGSSTHFRWGTYVTTKNRAGEVNDAVDSLMFVAGSAVDSVEGTTCGPSSS